MMCALLHAVWFILLLSAVEVRCDFIKEENIKIAKYRYDVEKWLSEVDSDLSQFNSLAARLTWKLSTKPDETVAKKARQLGKVRNAWKNKVCKSEIRKQWLTDEQRRKIYLLCRGPRYSEELSDMYLTVMGKMFQEYNSPICFSKEAAIYLQEMLPKYNSSPQQTELCVHGEPELERLMKRTDLSPKQLEWVWTTWHNHSGLKTKDMYRTSVFFQNLAAQNNGYHDMGDVWKEELEISDLEKVVMSLYDEIKPLYMMLHAVIRHKLYLKHGPLEIDPNGPIPIHLLGNMWGQDWSALINLFVEDEERMIDLDKNLKKKSWNVLDMVAEAEDFYVSLGLPRMTEKFWEFSVFEENENTSMCHGTAANMYAKGDFRMLLCAQVNMEDFYVIHHEMGHIEYYMAYENQPAIFQEGTNSAFHESIGDAVMHGVLTPLHLQRLGLISDDDLSNPGLEMLVLLQQALSKIPEIPFSLLVDKYRWDIFAGKVHYNEYNTKYWDLNLKIRGVVPADKRGEEFFDAAAKFHIPDNTPYIRYFLTSILQMEIFKTMCDISLYGDDISTNGNDDIAVPLHRCDIYGSKKSGKRLKLIMEKGASIKWNEALNILNGRDYISTKPLLEYYQPVYEWLRNYIDVYNVHVGW